MQDTQVTAVEVIVTGRVQGVYFRAGCADEAARLGVRGWAHNEADGSVRGHFEGPADAVDALVTWCRTGTPRADVTEVTVTAASVQHLADFDVS